MGKVYCFGHISTGKIHRIAGSFPKANGYGEVVETLQNFSGEATGTAMVLNRLGIDVRLAGNWIGDNQQGRLTIDFLAKRGINTERLRIEPGYEGVNEIVFTDGVSRTVFGRYIDLLFSHKQWDDPLEEDVINAEMVSIDASFGSAAEQVGAWAKSHQKPYVVCDVIEASPLFQGAHCIIQSEEFLKREYPDIDLAELLEQMLQKTKGWLVFTFGEKPLWYGKGILGRKKLPVYKIDPLDTAGAGDSFRGGLIYGMLQGWDFKASLQYASAVAALVCLSTPGACDSPSLEQVENFQSLHSFLNEGEV